MEGKIKFKKKKFGGARRLRPAEDDVDDDEVTSFVSVKSDVRKSKVNRWAKYLTLGEMAEDINEVQQGQLPHSQPQKSQPNQTQQAFKSTEDDEGGVFIHDSKLEVVSNSVQLELSNEKTSLVEDDPMVVDMDTVTSVDSLGAYVNVVNNTFTLKESHYRDTLPTLTQEYDDLDEDTVKPKFDDKEDEDMYDVEIYGEKPRNFNSDMYAFEVLSDASDEAGVKISPVKVSSIDELIGSIQEEAERLRISISTSTGELGTLKMQLERAQTKRQEVVSLL